MNQKRTKREQACENCGRDFEVHPDDYDAPATCPYCGFENEILRVKKRLARVARRGWSRSQEEFED